MTKTNKGADDFFDNQPKLESWEVRAGIRRLSAEEAKQESERAAALKSKMDEEYELERVAKIATIAKPNNGLASVFRIFAWIALIIGGIIVAVNLSKLSIPAYSAEASIIVTGGLIVGIGGFISLFAIGEVIQILHDIRRKLYDSKK